MEVIIDRGAALDLHNKTIRVCALLTEGRSVEQKLATFGTTQQGRVGLREWLEQNRVTHVTMEATGEFWKPVYAELEGGFVLTVTNPQHVKNVPGRKTDTSDVVWHAELHRYGLLRPSFVPPAPIRELRDLTRSRRKSIQAQSRVENRTRKILEGAGIKLGAVVSDLFGKTGRSILDQMAQGRTEPSKLVQLAKGTLKQKKPELSVALEGTFTEHHSLLLQDQLRVHDAYTKAIHELDQRIARQAEPWTDLIRRLDQIPGVNPTAAVEILAEVGTDMAAWKYSWRFAAWAGLCPGNHESAGKRRQVSVRKGNPFLRSILVQCATAAVRTKGTYYRAKFQRLCARRGYKRAIVAIAHAMLIAIYFMIRDGKDYVELGETFVLQRTRTRTTHRLVEQLSKLGYTVTLTENTPTEQPSASGT